MLSRDEILNANDVPTEIVDVPEWGGKVAVRGLTVAERELFEKQVTEWKKGEVRMRRENTRSLLVSMCCVNDAGERLFQPSDIPLLGKKSAKALERVWNVAAHLSGMLSDEEVDEEIVADFEPAQSDAISSD